MNHASTSDGMLIKQELIKQELIKQELIKQERTPRKACKDPRSVLADVVLNKLKILSYPPELMLPTVPAADALSRATPSDRWGGRLT
jgi:hypothetical protein